MMLYSKNGSIPKPETDGTEGWIEVPEPPVAGDGQEVVWWFPPGWVVRPVCPNEAGMTYNWSQSNQEWVATPVEMAEIITDTSIDSIVFGSAESTAGTASAMAASADITLDLGSAQPQ
jgi:hypothetical protein